MKYIGLLAVVVIVVGWAVTAEAVPTADDFKITMDGQNALVSGGGSGWNSGQWVSYPDTGWWNQWFYDGKPDPNRWKRIDYDFDIVPLAGALGGDVTVVINYSTLQYQETGSTGEPPVPPFSPGMEPVLINRQRVAYQGAIPDTVTQVTGGFDIPDYNPEWISIDVRTADGEAVDTVTVEGDIWHECLPKPPVHEPLLNWDFIVPDAQMDVTDLQIVVANPDFQPGADGLAAGGPAGWQASSWMNRVDHDGDPATPEVTVVTWYSSMPLQPGTEVHVGMDLAGAGRILDGYWTSYNAPIAGFDIPIVDEETWVWGDGLTPDGGGEKPREPGQLEMRLGTDLYYDLENPDDNVELRNVRAWTNIPTGAITLAELNDDLLPTDPRLAGKEVTLSGGGLYHIDSFFDVFCEIDLLGDNEMGAQYSSLLTADVYVNDELVGQFWNLNTQCPEPGTMLLLGTGVVGVLGYMRRRRVK